MALVISENQLHRLSEFVSSQMGLHFPRERWLDLERGILSAAKEFRFEDTATCIQWLTASPLTKGQIEVLASHLTVGETYFFREKKAFEALEQHILPELIRSRFASEKRLRIWCAGCCSGEEAYSIAILLSRVIPDWKDWNITLLATDINPRFLHKAFCGVYGDWSFRDTPSEIKERYFKDSRRGQFEILPDIKNIVSFSYLNLAEDIYPSLTNNTNAMDIIFCRNVLMYFNPVRAKSVVDNFYRTLVDGGWLIVSPSELSSNFFPGFTSVNVNGAILYKKGRIGPISHFDLAEFNLEADIHPLPPLESVYSESDPESNILATELRADLFSDSHREQEDEGKPEVALDSEARMLYQQGIYDDAMKKISSLLSLKPEDSHAMALAARILANQGKLAEALEWCRKAIAVDKLNPSYYYLLAIVLQERNDLIEASRALRQALYVDRNYVLAHFALGNVARKQSSFDESGKHFENALKLLGTYSPGDILPDSDGITAGRLTEIIRSTTFDGIRV